MKSSLAFLFLMMQCLDCSYVWPDVIQTTNGKAIIVVYSKDLTGDFEDGSCSEIQVIPEDYIMLKLSTIDTVRMRMWIIDINKCKYGDQIVIRVGNDELTTTKYHSKGVAKDWSKDFTVITPECSAVGGRNLVTLPCVEDSIRRGNCHYWHYCGNEIKEKSPDTIIKGQTGTNSTTTIMKDKGEDCFSVPVETVNVKCTMNTNSMLMEQQKGHCHIEFIEGTKLKKSIYKIKAAIGETVCITWKLRSKIHQQCKVATSHTVEFEADKANNKIEVYCSSTGGRINFRESADMICPIFFDHTISVAICEEFHNPTMFWTSLIWLIIGIPLIWLTKFSFNKMYKKTQMMKLKKGGRCDLCMNGFCGPFERAFHENCKFKKCAYCEHQCYSLAELKSHSINCERKKDRKAESEEVLSYKRRDMDVKFDGYQLYSSKTTKVEWLVVFFFLVLLSLAPTSNAGCVDYSRSCTFEINQHCRRVLHSQSVTAEREGGGSSWSQPKDYPQVDQETVLINDQADANVLLLEQILKFKDELLMEIGLLRSNVMGLEAKVNQNCGLKEREYEVVSSRDLIRTDHEEIGLRIHPDDIAPLQIVITNMAQAVRSRDVQHDMKEVGMVHASSGGAANIAGDAGVQIAAGSGNPIISAGNATMLAQPNHHFGQQEREMTIHKVNHGESRRRMLQRINERENRRTRRSTNDLEDKYLENVITAGTNDTAKISQLMPKLSVLHKSKNFRLKSNHERWYDFEGANVCKVNCMHAPGSCQCISEMDSEFTSLVLPWTTLNQQNLKTAHSSIEIKDASLREVVTQDGDLKIDGLLEGSLKFTEGSGVSFRIKSENVVNSPTISLIIPQISQIYSTKFLYYTCERKFSNEVKGVCVGECNGYCGGRFCLGNRIWSWKGCRGVSCNPTWCWNTGGCCCCGLNIECKRDSLIAAVWQLHYIKTEYVACLLVNNRGQYCKLVTEATKFKVGQFEVELERAPRASKKIDTGIVTIHKRINERKMKNLHMYGQPEEIYYDADICGTHSSCNHGSIGDIQSTDIKCLSKLGSDCFESKEDLKKSECFNEIYVSYTGVQMNYECRTGSWHTCKANNIASELDFASQLEDQPKLREDFIIKKLVTNLENSSLLIYVNSRQSESDLKYKIYADEILLPTKEKTPVIKSIKISNCEGCHSCSMGFQCSVSALLESKGKFLISFYSKNAEIVMSDAVYELTQGMNSVKVLGHSYSNVNSANICAKYGEYEKCSKAGMQLRDPKGEYIPSFDNDETGSIDDTNIKCVGISSLSCWYENIAGYFAGWKRWITDFAYVFLLIIFLVALSVFLPQLVRLLRNCFKIPRIMKSQNFKVPSRTEAKEILKALRRTKVNSRLEKIKKEDDETFVPLFADGELE